MCLMEVLLVLFPAPPTAFIPTGAFGGLLLLVGASLLIEWLIEARHRFSAPEYLVLLFTFASIHVIGLEAGFAAGLAFQCAGLCVPICSGPRRDGRRFVGRSKKARSVRRRSFEERRALHDHRESIAHQMWSAFVFFGGGRNSRPKMKHESKGAAWVVLNFEECVGLDATAARSCFAPFKQYLVQEKRSLLVAGLRARRRTAQWDSFVTTDQALESAEDSLLARFKVVKGSFSELQQCGRWVRLYTKALRRWHESGRQSFNEVCGSYVHQGGRAFV